MADVTERLQHALRDHEEQMYARGVETPCLVRVPSMAPSFEKRKSLDPHSNATQKLPIVWSKGSPVERGFQTFISRLDNSIFEMLSARFESATYPNEETGKQKLAQLYALVKENRGAAAVATTTGVFNIARLFQIFRSDDMNVNDALAHVFQIVAAREEMGMDAKRYVQ